MGSKFVVVAGNGETTRVNVEALLEDYFRGKGKDVVLVLPFNDRPSQGQVWAHQVSSELEIPTTVICPENSVVMSLGSSSVYNSPDPIQATLELTSNEEAVALLLWNESDSFTSSAAAAFKEALVPCYDLCIGLFEVSVGNTVIEPQEVVTEEISNVETKVKANDLKVNVNAAYLSELITKKVMEALKEAGLA
jgi:uncharacterized membrane protein